MKTKKTTNIITQKNRKINIYFFLTVTMRFVTVMNLGENNLDANYVNISNNRHHL